jgi:hypothetical protein
MQTSIDFPDSHRVAQCSDEIGGDLVQALVGGDDLVILAEQLIKQRCNRVGLALYGRGPRRPAMRRL